MGLVRAVVICAVFGFITGSGSSVDASLVKSVGENVLFNISRDPAPYTNLSWNFWQRSLSIISVSDGVNSTHPLYADRITLFAEGSLELRNLMEIDSGAYMVEITPTEGPIFRDIFVLDVLQPISDVRLTASPTDLTEFSYVTFNCSASGSHPWHAWYNKTLSMGVTSSETLTGAVDRYDTGPFRCEAYNDINRVSSEEVSLTISYGPEVTLKTVPLQDTYAEGSTVTLTCTVDSKPEAEITWQHSEVLLPFNGTELVLEALTYEQRGQYRCTAYNHKTDRKRSKSEYISVEYSYSDDTLSVAASLGIALACVAVAAGIAAGLAYLYHRKRKRAGAH